MKRKQTERQDDSPKLPAPVPHLLLRWAWGRHRGHTVRQGAEARLRPPLEAPLESGSKVSSYALCCHAGLGEKTISKSRRGQNPWAGQPGDSRVQGRCSHLP